MKKNKGEFKFLGQELASFKKKEKGLAILLFIEPFFAMLEEVGEKDEVEFFTKYRIIKKK